MSRRAYLHTADRRRQLLDAAARLFVREGFSGMTMVALANEAGVSRRLVYDHFPDLASLYEAFFDDRAARYLAAIDAAVSAADDATTAFTAAYEQLLMMPAEDQRVVHLLVADPGLPDLQPLRERFRQHIEQRWLDKAPTPLGAHERGAHARVALWTLVGALLGLAELVAREEVSREAAIRIAASLSASLPAAVGDADLMPT